MPTYTIETPEGRKLKIEAPDEATAIRGAQNWSLEQKSAKGKKSGVLDQIGAFAQSATEQVPFLDEAAAGATALITRRPYEQVRQVQGELAAEDRAERPLARNAGGVAGFGATMLAPGGGYIKGAKTLPQAASRSAQVGAAYGALTGAGGAEGGMEERAKAGAGGAAIGAATGGALPFIGRGVSEALKKSPKTMGLPELEAAKRAAYQDPALQGVVFSPDARAELARTLQNEMLRLRMNPKRHGKAASVVSEIVGELKGKKPFTLDDLDQLRQVAWRDAASLKTPEMASDAMMGSRVIDLLDEFVDGADASKVLAGDPQAASAALGKARDLNTRWRKALDVTNRLDSAELQASSAYTGTNLDNNIRQKMRPLVDPKSGQRMRNATPDEQKAVRKVAKGTVPQNVARAASHLMDPRRLMSMPLTALSGTTALSTMGASLIPQGVGLLSTVSANRASQKNVKGLLDLIAVGGSKEALKKAPTKASKAAAKAVEKGQELPGLAGFLAEALASGGLR